MEQNNTKFKALTHKIIEFNKMKIGFMGLVDENCASVINFNIKVDYEDYIQAAKKYVQIFK